MGALCWALAACGGPREPWGQLGGERGARAPPRFEQRVPDRRPRLARVQTKRKPPLRPGSAPLRLREPVSGAAHEPRAACARAGPHCRGHLVAGLSASPDPEQHPARKLRPPGAHTPALLWAAHYIEFTLDRASYRIGYRIRDTRVRETGTDRIRLSAASRYQGEHEFIREEEAESFAKRV